MDLPKDPEKIGYFIVLKASKGEKHGINWIWIQINRAFFTSATSAIFSLVDFSYIFLRLVIFTSLFIIHVKNLVF